MGGWVAGIGDIAGFEAGIENFRKVFSVGGVPGLKTELTRVSQRAASLAWAWNENLVPDVHVFSDDSGSLLVACGAITGLGRFAKADVADQASLPQKIWSLWNEHGDGLIPEINGSFSLLFHNARTEETTIYADRFASRSVWMTGDNGARFIGNFPAALAVLKQDGVSLNPAGLWSLLHMGRHVGRRGLYHGFECLLAREKAVVKSGGEPVISRWHDRRYVPDRNPSPRQWGERLSAALKTSAERYRVICRAPHIFLSGGLDSRIAAAGLGAPANGVSLCSCMNAEVRLASRVAKTIGIDHEIIVRSPYWYLDTLDAAALVSSGNYLTAHTHFFVPVSEKLKTRPEAEFFLGDLLENFNKHYFYSPDGKTPVFDPHNMMQTLHSSVPYSLKDLNRLGKYFNKDLKSRIYDLYRDSLEEYSNYISYVSDDDADKMDTLLRWADVSITPTYNMITCIWPLSRERNLYFDNDLDDVSRRIPSDIRGAGVLHKWILHYLNSKLLLIPDSNTWLPPIVPKKLGMAAKRVRPMLGKIRRRLISKGPDRPVLATSGSWVLFRELYRKDARYKSRIEELLTDKTVFVPDIFDNVEITKAWRKFVAGDISLQFEIDALLSFGVLSKSICYNNIIF